MMECSRNKNRGVITVLISLLLVGVLSVGTLSIEAGRYQAAKTQLAESNISASTSMIAAYDAELYARYGLLAIDTARFTPERAADYLNFNADQAVGYRGNRLSRLYVVDSVELTGLYNLTYPAVLKRQILSRAKYHIVPQDHALNVYTMDAFFADFQSKCQYVMQHLDAVANTELPNGAVTDIPGDMYAALKALRDTYASVEMADTQCNMTLTDMTVSLLPSTTGTVVTEAPGEDLIDINTALTNAVTILGGTGAGLSYNNCSVQTETDVSVLVPDTLGIKGKAEDILFGNGDPTAVRAVANEIRAAAAAMNAAIDVLKANKESNILLNSYIASYFSNRCNTAANTSAPARGSGAAPMENANFISACVEYVFGGSRDEQQNQKSAYAYLQTIRLINNLHAVMSGLESAGVLETRWEASAVIAWAYYETLTDMELTIRYNVAVPFNKNALLLSPDAPANVAAAFAGKNLLAALTTLGFYDEDETSFTVEGAYPLSYRESLALGLWFVPNTQKLLRVADLIQLEMRYHEQHVENKPATFMLGNQNTYCRIKCVGRFSAVLPMLSLDTGNSARGIKFQSIKYAGY